MNGSTTAGGGEEKQDQKIVRSRPELWAAPTLGVGSRVAFLQTKKRPCKARPILVLVPRETEVFHTG